MILIADTVDIAAALVTGLDYDDFIAPSREENYNQLVQDRKSTWEGFGNP